MSKYYWIKSDGRVEEISKNVYLYLKNQQYSYDDSGASNHHLLVEKTKSKLNILYRNWIPDIPIKSLKEILV